MQRYRKTSCAHAPSGVHNRSEEYKNFEEERHTEKQREEVLSTEVRGEEGPNYSLITVGNAACAEAKATAQSCTTSKGGRKFRACGFSFELHCS